MLKTPKLQLNKPEGTDVVNIADLNANMDKLDTEVTKLATLSADGRMSKDDKAKLNALPSGADITQLSNSLTMHLADDASLTKKGHVQLSNSTTSTSDTLAATPSAVKQAMDRADAAFTSASNGKATVVNAITGVDPNVVIPTDPTFNDLAIAIGQISTGLISDILPGTTVVFSDSTIISTAGEKAYYKVFEYRILFSGVYRVNFDIKDTGNSSNQVQGRIYKNGSPFGLIRNTPGGGPSVPFTTFTQDLAFHEGDLLQMYLNVGRYANMASIGNVKLGIATPIFSEKI